MNIGGGRRCGGERSFGFLPNLFLSGRVSAEQVQRERKRGRRGVMPGKQENLDLIPNFGIRQSIAVGISGLPGGQQLL